MQIIKGLKKTTGYVSSLKKRVQTLMPIVFTQQILMPTSPLAIMIATHSIAMHVACEVTFRPSTPGSTR
jgi:hypothetical protein